MRFLSAALFLDNYRYWQRRLRSVEAELYETGREDFVRASKQDDLPRAGRHVDLGDLCEQRDARLRQLRETRDGLVEKLCRCRRILDEAPAELQAALTAHYAEGLSWREVADAVGVRCHDTVRKRCLRYLEGVDSHQKTDLTGKPSNP